MEAGRRRLAYSRRCVCYCIGMTTTRSGIQLAMTDALVTAMERADAALDAGDTEAHGIWQDWSQTLSAQLTELARRQ